MVATGSESNNLVLRTSKRLSREAHEMCVDLLLAGDLVALALLSSFLVHLLQLVLLRLHGTKNKTREEETLMEH